MESKWGLVPDMSISVTLRELVPIDVAKELTMTHRIFKGEEAKVGGSCGYIAMIGPSFSMAEAAAACGVLGAVVWTTRSVCNCSCVLSGSKTHAHTHTCTHTCTHTHTHTVVARERATRRVKVLRGS